MTAIKEKKELSLEDSLEELENIVSKMESRETSLDQALKFFEQGIDLSKKCHSRLNKAAGKVEKLINDLNGTATTEEYDFKEDRREL